MPSGGEILTVGHSNHEEEEFLELVRGAGVELIADVRANPRSRYPQFNRSALAGTMKAAGIGYAPLGADLGGRRAPAENTINQGWDVEAFRGYADHMASEQFEAGLGMLESLARDRRTAVMCAEARLDPLPSATARRQPHGPRLAGPAPGADRITDPSRAHRLRGGRGWRGHLSGPADLAGNLRSDR